MKTLAQARAERAKQLTEEMIQVGRGCGHEKFCTSDPGPFLGSVAGREGPENRAAHGNVEVQDICFRCGLSRRRLINGRHEEVSAWEPDPARVAKRVMREIQPAWRWQ